MAIAAVTPCDVAFFFLTLCAETLFPLYFEPMPNLSKTLKGLLTPHVILLSTIFQLNSLNITVSVYVVSGSKVNRKERSRPSLFVCLFLCSTLLNICFRREVLPCVAENSHALLFPK